jgi:branched-chain amino acid transport system permease protein
MTNIARRFINLFILLLVIFIPLLVQKDMFLLNMAILSAIYIILTASLRLVFITGIWHVGQAAFYSLGAYSIVLIMESSGLSFWLCLPLVALLSFLVAAIIGIITLRVKGIYFCILSISLAEVFRLTYIYTRTASERIMRASPPNPIILGNLIRIDFSSNRLNYYYLMLVAVVLCLIILNRLEKARFGQILRAIEKNELLARSVGINTLLYKVAAFAICSFFAGLAGGLFASYNIVITSTSFSSSLSMLFAVMMVVGGMRSIYGSIAGPIFLTILPEYLPLDPIEIKIVYGATLILTISLLPEGLVSIPDRIKRMFKVHKREDSKAIVHGR